MIEYILGETVTFTGYFYDSNGDLADPTDVTLKVVRSGTVVVYGPFVYSSSEVTKLNTGIYTRDVTFQDFLVPGIYSARWEGEVEGDLQILTEDVLISEELPTPNELLDPPRVYGIMRPSFTYGDMGLGSTDQLFLIGHADGLNLNDPYQVRNMQEAINILGADDSSPLARGLLESYNAGARDIYLVAAAPMREFIEFDIRDSSNRFVAREEWGGLNFYERYEARLETTIATLKDWDLPEIIVPLELPYFTSEGHNYGGQTLFYDLVMDNMANKIIPPIVIMGNRLGEWTTDQVDQAIAERQSPFDPIEWFYDNDYLDEDAYNEYLTKAPSKYFMLVWGEATMSLPQLPRAYNASPIAAIAGGLSSHRLDHGYTWAKVPGVIAPIGRDLTAAEVKELSRVRLNPIVRTVKGKRGTPYQTVLATDNTSAVTGSSFWSVIQLRLVVKISRKIHGIGYRHLGTLGYGLFQQGVYDFLDQIIADGIIKDYRVTFSRRQDADQTVLVELGLQPYTGVREIFFQVEVVANPKLGQ